MRWSAVRVTVDITPGQHDQSYLLHVAAADFEDSRPVMWLAGGLLVASAAAGTVDDPAGLVRAVECCDTDGDEAEQREQLNQLRKYGELLFQAAFGDKWEQIVEAAVKADADYLEVAVRGADDDDHAALQALRWEALHDGTGFVAAQGTTYQGRNIHVGVVRFITPSRAVPGNDVARGTGLPEITHIPKVLFAVGSHLTDKNVRPGAEFMGIMRRLDRDGGSIRARLLECVTRPKLVAELAVFKPDVLHLIGHGELLADGQVRVQLRGDFDEKCYYASADEMLGAFAEAEHWPVMVVLSACQTGTAGDGRVSTLPFAARLVAGNSVSRGVPVVVAMAGDISDTACRVFTQALTTAVGAGVPLGKAVIRGRRAAFYNGPGPDAQHPAPDSGHWVMPALFLADYVGRDVCLVRTDAAKAAQKRVKNLNLDIDPLFYGRAPFITALDRLLDAGDDLNVLVAYFSNQDKSYGGMRLLQELGARAVRSGVLPVLLGEFDNDGPRDLKALAIALEGRINDIRAEVLGLEERRSETVAAVSAGANGLGLAKAIRRDLDALVAVLPEDDPVRYRAAGQPRTILLCHRVDGWATVLDDLLDLLGPHGLKGGVTPVPVVLTGAVRSLKAAAGEDARFRRPWISFEKLRRFQRAEDTEDILAYQWWLLNPPVTPDGRQRAFAPKRGAPGDDWKNTLRTVLDDKNVMYDPVIYALAAGLSCLVSASDDALLASYAQVLK